MARSAKSGGQQAGGSWQPSLMRNAEFGVRNDPTEPSTEGDKGTGSAWRIAGRAAGRSKCGLRNTQGVPECGIGEPAKRRIGEAETRRGGDKGTE
jgi:hypothetical protein